MYIAVGSVGLGYNILDTGDGVTEYCTLEQVRSLLNDGVEIYGVSLAALKVGGLIPVVMQWTCQNVVWCYDGLLLKRKSKIGLKNAQILTIKSLDDFRQNVGVVRQLNKAAGVYNFPSNFVCDWTAQGTMKSSSGYKVIAVDENSGEIKYLSLTDVFEQYLHGRSFRNVTLNSYDKISVFGRVVTIYSYIQDMLVWVENNTLEGYDKGVMGETELREYLGIKEYRKTDIFELPIYNLYSHAIRSSYTTTIKFLTRFNGIREGKLYANEHQITPTDAVKNFYSMIYDSDAEQEKLWQRLMMLKAKSALLGGNRQYEFIGWDAYLGRTWELGGKGKDGCLRKIEYSGCYHPEYHIRTPWGCIHILSAYNFSANDGEGIFLVRLKGLELCEECIYFNEMQVMPYKPSDAPCKLLCNTVKGDEDKLRCILSAAGLGYHCDSIYPIGVKDVQLMGDGVMISILCLIDSNRSQVSWDAATGYAAAVIPLLFTGCDSTVYEDGYWFTQTLCHDIWMEESVVKHLVGTQEVMAGTGKLMLETGTRKIYYSHQDSLNFRVSQMMGRFLG